MCKDARACGRTVCFFAHGPEELRTPEDRTVSVKIVPQQETLPSPLSTAGTAPGFQNGCNLVTRPKHASSSSISCLGSFLDARSSKDVSMHGSSRNSPNGLLDLLRMQDSPLPTPSPPTPPNLSLLHRQTSMPSEDIFNHHPYQGADLFLSPAMIMNPCFSPLPTNMGSHAFSSLGSQTAFLPVGSIAQPDMTHPLLAGALQAGVLDQVLAQLTPQQLTLLSHQPPQQLMPSYQMMQLACSPPYQQGLNHSTASMLTIPEQNNNDMRRSMPPQWNPFNL